MPQYKFLRISVTDRCDLNCVYCRSDCAVSRKMVGMMSFENIVRVVKFLKQFGISHIRLTGGEPLLRRDLPRLIEMIVPHVETVNMTTNGTRLAENAQGLRLAGLKKVNIHIDTLDGAKFGLLTGGNIDTVLMGIESAQRAGLSVKLNAVLLRGINDNEVVSLAEFAASIGAPIRFIELMPFCDEKFYRAHFISIECLFEALNLEPIAEKFGTGPAEYYKDSVSGAIIGVISPLTRKFCCTCNRLRLTSDGRLKRCLAKEDGLDLASCSFDINVIEKYLLGKEHDHKSFLENGVYSLRSIGG